MTAILVKAIRDLRRRRLQAAVIFITTLLAVGTGTMALTLLSQTRDPYQTAFEAQQGAHLQVAFDSRTHPQAIATTAHLLDATAFGGPYAVTSLQFQAGSRKFVVDTIGRDDPGGRVEQLRITAGQWPSSNDQIALTRSFSELNNISVGDKIKVVSVASEPVLTVAAEVVDIDEGSADLSSQHAWMLSSAIPAVTVPNSSYYLMTYRFATDPSSAQLQSDVDRLRAALPAGSVVGSVNYLLVRNIFNVTNQIVTSVLIAFSIFAIAATGAIVANLVTGIVISAYREIGIMKAVGFTPLQVVAVFELQILIPAGAASLLGIPAGILASQPLLANSSHALGLTYTPSFALGIDLVSLPGAVLIVALAALLPALRAGLLQPIVVIASAGAPRGQSGRGLRRLAARVRLPRPVVLGFGDAFARPARAILTLVAILLGVATIIVALGLPRSFTAINNSETNAGNVDVVVSKSPALSDADALAVINAQPETSRVVAVTVENFTVPGIGDPVNAHIFRGDSSHLGYMLVAGRWFTGPGEVLAPKALLRESNLKIGDHFNATTHGSSIPMLVVGEVYDINSFGVSLFMDWGTLSSVESGLTPDAYLIKLTPGADVGAYVRRVAATQPDLLDVQPKDTSIIAPVKIIDTVLLIIAVVIGLIAVGGIFNTVLLNTRERVRDTAMLKAVGMSPRQVMAMVTSSAGVIALVGGIIAVPAGVGLHRYLLDLISNSAGNDTPLGAYGVFGAPELIAIPFVGVLVAVAAALIPGRWAARTNVVEVLHAE